MKKIIFLLFVLASCMTFNAKAQLLWEISGNGLENPSYLYGTMHIGDKRVYQFNDSLLTVFDECDLFAGELDLLNQSIFSSIRLLLGMRMEDDTTLRELLPREKYAFVKRKLDKRLHELNLLSMVDVIEQVKPIFISIILSDLSTQMTQSSRPAVDLYFQQIAQQKDMEVIGLETMDEQMAVFDKIPLKTQAEMLYDELKQKDSGEMDMDKLIDIYAQEDLDSLFKLTQSSMDEKMNEEMLFKRNINMANRMEPHMKKKRIFVGVGAAHLPGPGGVIDLLRKKGYILRPVNFED